MSEPVHAVGIDLGTTHCALSSIDLELSEGEEVAESRLDIPQVVAPGQVEARPLLPSFLYLPHESELPDGALTLPWPGHPTRYRGGRGRALARREERRAARVERQELAVPPGGRSARRHPARGCTGGGAQGVAARGQRALPRAPARRLGPAHARCAAGRAAGHHHRACVVRSRRARAHRRSRAHRGPRPRSAARGAAGRAVQLAVGHARRSWRKQVQRRRRDPGGRRGRRHQRLLADRGARGGGRPARSSASPWASTSCSAATTWTSRSAYVLQDAARGRRRDARPSQLTTLTQAARVAKEQLLANPHEQSAPVVIPGRGSKLIGGSLQHRAHARGARARAARRLLPAWSSPRRARISARSARALTQLGLPYAQDAAITRHLAAFLARQAGALGQRCTRFARPTALLFNGGVFKSRSCCETR